MSNPERSSLSLYNTPYFWVRYQDFPLFPPRQDFYAVFPRSFRTPPLVFWFTEAGKDDLPPNRSIPKPRSTNEHRQIPEHLRGWSTTPPAGAVSTCRASCWPTSARSPNSIAARSAPKSPSRKAGCWRSDAPRTATSWRGAPPLTNSSSSPTVASAATTSWRRPSATTTATSAASCASRPSRPGSSKPSSMARRCRRR